jgi:adenylate cyclase
MFTFGSFQSRLSFFLLCLLLPVLGGTFYYVNKNNQEYTQETINSYLEIGADVFDYTRNQKAETLNAITNSLTWDFGFRTAYASKDPGTIFDAALNVLDRSLDNADMLMIVDLDYTIIIDTEVQGDVSLKGAWLELINLAENSDEGFADAMAVIDGQPFQLIALPLYLPRQVAWIIGGFALDQEFAEQVSETVVSDVSILRSSSGSNLELVASTLEPSRQQTMVNQISVSSEFFGKLQAVVFDEEVFTSLVRPLFSSDDTQEKVFAVIQRSYNENNENVVLFQRMLVEFYGVVILLSLIAVFALARSITNPLASLASAVQKIEKGNYDLKVNVKSRDEIGRLASMVNSMAKGLIEKEKVRDLLGKVVSKQIAQQLLSNPIELGGEEKVVTILFSDIRGFTTFCEGLPPKQVLEELNRVLSTVSNIVESYDGVVDKFQGDAVMALFGAPVTGALDAPNAMSAALDIVHALDATDSRLSACVGINTGLVVAGNLGSDNRLNYSVIGDAVNLCARLESLTRLYNVSNIVSEASSLAAPNFVYKELDSVCVAGKKQPVVIYELLGEQGQVSKQRIEESQRYAQALKAYRKKDWQSAHTLFSDLKSSCDNKLLHQVFLDRIHDFQLMPPPADWDGVFVFGKK